jgi:hypothetical protein
MPSRSTSLLPNITVAFLTIASLLHGVVEARPAGQRNLYKTLTDSVTLDVLTHGIPNLTGPCEI